MTNQAMLDRIKDNLGNRVSGRIGSRSVDTVVLEAINLALPHLTLEAQPDYYNRVANITLIAPVYDDSKPPILITPGIRDYDLPTLDEEGNTIRIKDIYSHRCFAADGNNYDLVHLNYYEFVKRTRDYNINVVGVPRLFALWGQENTLHLDYIPSQNLTLTMYVESYPNQVTSGQLGDPMPIDSQWDLAVEAFGTKYCYLKLQQTEMYAVWDDLYQKQKASLSRDESAKQSKNISQEGTVSMVNDPVNNPFITNWN